MMMIRIRYSVHMYGIRQKRKGRIKEIVCAGGCVWHANPHTAGFGNIALDLGVVVGEGGALNDA